MNALAFQGKRISPRKQKKPRIARKNIESR